MKTVYVAHPLSGNIAENTKKINILMTVLYIKYPDICFVSPLHNFVCDTKTQEKTILAKCFNLIKKCDEIWAYGKTSYSVGCRAELAFATYASIPIKFKDEEATINEFREGK